MSKKKPNHVVHIYRRATTKHRVYCENQERTGIPVEFHNLWAVKKQYLCKKCLSVMKKKGLE